MDDSGLSVHYSSLDTAATDIRTAAKSLDTQLSNLLAKVKAVAETWEGEAHQAFTVAANEWERRARHIKTTLDDVATRVDTAKGSYREQDVRASKYFTAGY